MIVSPELAAEIVWLDALTTNVDRMPRNTNMLLWQGRLWLIDPGAAQHDDPDFAGPPAHVGLTLDPVAELGRLLDAYVRPPRTTPVDSKPEDA